MKARSARLRPSSVLEALMPEKTITLIRHAESTFNKIVRETGVDPMHFDAPLSERGKAQLVERRDAAAALEIDLIVTTPFSRALQTTEGLFGDRSAVVEAMHREHLQSSCDVGRPSEALRQAFPRFRFDHLDNPWWHTDPAARGPIAEEPLETLNQRVEAFRDWLGARPERRIAVVGHGTFFFHFSGHFLDNCAFLEMTL